MESDYFYQDSERLIYRPLTVNDVPAWIPFFTNLENPEFLGLPTDLDPQEGAENWVNRQLVRYKETGLGGLAIVRKSDGKLVGISGIILREIEGEIHYEIAYSVLPDERNNGYAREAARHFHQSGLDSKLSDHLISIIHIDNVPSQKVAESNNMIKGDQTVYKDEPVYVFRTKC